MCDRILSASRALERWPLDVEDVRELAGGLINWSFRVRAAQGAFALQRVASIFSPQVCDDVANVTAHLEAKGVSTPQIVPSQSGANFEIIDGHPWRLMSFVEGRVHARVDRPEIAREAGAALARFHDALSDYATPFSARRLGVHDTERHLAGLKAALESRADHRRWSEVEPLARRILDHRLPELPPTPERIVHGDPKITNLIFDTEGDRARAWVDLDTVAPMPLPLEIGDALRSWCNPSGEDELDARLDLDRFDAAVDGYLGSARFVTYAEVMAFAAGTERIALELAARFARDALEESYFGWSAERFESASHHNAFRARVQLALAESVRGVRSEAEARVKDRWRARRP